MRACQQYIDEKKDMLVRIGPVTVKREGRVNPVQDSSKDGMWMKIIAVCDHLLLEAGVASSQQQPSPPWGDHQYDSVVL